MKELRKPLIISDQNILDGEPVFRGTRVPFRNLVDYLEGGEPLEEFLDDLDQGRMATREPVSHTPALERVVNDAKALCAVTHSALLRYSRTIEQQQRCL